MLSSLATSSARQPPNPYQQYITPEILHSTLAGVAGIMVYMSFGELLPTAVQSLPHKVQLSLSLQSAAATFTVGMFVMYVSMEFLQRMQLAAGARDDL